MGKTAEEIAKLQKEISVSEFFEKNKHLLGFDNPVKALLMAIKEAVDNSLDACQEADTLPEIEVKVKDIGDEKYRISIKDNGPGIVKEQIPNIFGKLLYGSKFHSSKQSRGQQGIGISSVVLYAQLTTGKPAKIWSKTSPEAPTNYCELRIDTMKNSPKPLKEETVDDKVIKDHGTKIEVDLIGKHRKTQSVGDYIKQTSISNPFAKLVYTDPTGSKIIYPRSVNELPRPPKEIKPHPYGIEYAILERMLLNTKSRNVISFISNDFSSTGTQSAKDICKTAKVDGFKKPNDLERGEIEKILSAMQKAKLQRPPMDCLSPIGSTELEKRLKKEFPEAELIVSVTREPVVYRGNPFQVEIGIVYGGELKKEEQVKVIRFANKVPLLFQFGACATNSAVKDVDWKRYGMQQQSRNMPVGPMILVIHVASVWVPFVSESKEAIAPYEDIVKEIKLGIQVASRDLSRYLSGKKRAGDEKRRLLIFERYSKEVAEALAILSSADATIAESDMEKTDFKKINKSLQELISDKSKLKELEEKTKKIGGKNV